jgi:hypothetical protein
MLVLWNSEIEMITNDGFLIEPKDFIHKKVLCVTLDEDLIGNKITETTDELTRQGIKATIFIDFRTKMSKETVKKLKSQGHECQMHWIRFPVRTKKYWYLLRKEVSFAEQKAILEAKLEQKITANRTHGLEFRGPNFIYAWEVMQKNGIKYSSTVFGFPEPFIPIDLDGNPFKLTEFPINCYEKIPKAENLVIWLGHPHYNNWKGVVNWAKSQNYEFWTLGEIYENRKN